jgi:ribose/xylose/arabinose/galactoside ABC-type transport system permease subunit
MPRVKALLGDNWPVLIFLVLLALVIALKGRFTAFDLRSLCANALPLALVALGQFVIVLGRGIDLSLGPVASVAGAVMALHMTDSAAIGLAGPILVGLAAGAINGFFVVWLRLPPIIVTLATMSVWQGVALLILPDPGGSIPHGFQKAVTGFFFVPLIELILFGAVAVWLLGTRFGLHLRAVGGDEQAARMSGVRVIHIRFLAYILGGLLAALCGMYLATLTASGSPTIGDSYILTSISAVVIGGVPLIGGRGSPVGVVMGALILTLTGSLLYFAQVSSFYQSIIDGLILLAVVGSSGTRAWLRELVRG